VKKWFRKYGYTVPSEMMSPQSSFSHDVLERSCGIFSRARISDLSRERDANRKTAYETEGVMPPQKRRKRGVTVKRGSGWETRDRTGRSTRFRPRKDALNLDKRAREGRESAIYTSPSIDRPHLSTWEAMNRIRLSMHREYTHCAVSPDNKFSTFSRIKSSEEETRSRLLVLLGNAYKRFLRWGTCCRAKLFLVRERIYTSQCFVRFALNSRSVFFDEVARRIFSAEYLIASFRLTPEFSTLNSVFILFHYLFFVGYILLHSEKWSGWVK